MFICENVCSYPYLSVCHYICLFPSASVRLSASVSLSVRQFVRLSVCLSVCLSFLYLKAAFHRKQWACSTGYACPGLFGYFGDIMDCRSFFICSWGVPYRFYCPSGTLWNPAESVCDWSRNVRCRK